MQSKKIEQVKTDKCLRHYVKPAAGYCRLCQAKREAKNLHEHARKIYVNGTS